MNLTDKYRSVLNLGEELNVTDGSVVEENGVLSTWNCSNSVRQGQNVGSNQRNRRCRSIQI
jgi:hypothetical protein